MHILIPIVVGVLSLDLGWWLRGLVSTARENALADKLDASNYALKKSISNAQKNFPANVAGAEKKGKV